MATPLADLEVAEKEAREEVERRGVERRTEEEALAEANGYRATVAVDFDGTLCAWDFPYAGPPKRGAVAVMQAMRKAHIHIVIHTCRMNEWRDSARQDRNFIIRTMERWLEKHQIPYNEIWCYTGKPVANAYIDNRGIAFRDNWQQIIPEIEGLTGVRIGVLDKPPERGDI